jgi:hypothetical protein
LSVPVLSWSLIDDRTGKNTQPKLRPAKQWQSTETRERDRVCPLRDSPRPAGGHNRFLHKARPSRPSEPILIPKLRIQFADFPYLHYSIDQRLFTLETCCGYGYELVRVRRNLPRIFKVPLVAHGCRENCGTLRLKAKTHSPCERIPGPQRLMQKRQLFPELQWASPGRVALPQQIRGSERFRNQVLEYGPDSLSAERVSKFINFFQLSFYKASPKP